MIFPPWQWVNSPPNAPRPGSCRKSVCSAVGQIISLHVAGGGVFVRSGPGKSYDSIASLTNGSDVKIVSSAGDGWYQITFSGNGGKTTTGYMKGDYLANS